MNVSTLQTLSFTLLFIISTSLGESKPDPLRDWAGNQVIGAYEYEVWIVGYHTGAIGAGSSTDQSFRHQYVIDKQWESNKTFDGNFVHIYPKFSAVNYGRITVATDCELTFGRRFWTISPNIGSVDQNFIITYNFTDPPPHHTWFQFIPVNGTSTNPYLYKLITKQQGIPIDIILITNPAGEKSLYLNVNNSIPDASGIRISFVKGKLSQLSTKASS